MALQVGDAVVLVPTKDGKTIAVAAGGGSGLDPSLGVTDHCAIRADGTGGKIQGSNVIISDIGSVSAPAFATLIGSPEAYLTINCDTIAAEGSDASVDIILTSKGASGSVKINTETYVDVLGQIRTKRLWTRELAGSTQRLYIEGNAIRSEGDTADVNLGFWTQGSGKFYFNGVEYISSGGGDVKCNVASLDNQIARFDSTTGKIIQNSLVTIDDLGGIVANEFATDLPAALGRVVISGSVVAAKGSGPSASLYLRTQGIGVIDCMGSIVTNLGLRITSSAGAGKVMTSDSVGNAYWATHSTIRAGETTIPVGGGYVYHYLSSISVVTANYANSITPLSRVVVIMARGTNWFWCKVIDGYDRADVGGNILWMAAEPS